MSQTIWNKNENWNEKNELVSWFICASGVFESVCAWILFLPLSFTFPSKSFLHLTAQPAQWSETLQWGKLGVEQPLDLRVLIYRPRYGFHITVMETRLHVCTATTRSCLRANLLFCVWKKWWNKKRRNHILYIWYYMSNALHSSDIKGHDILLRGRRTSTQSIYITFHEG